MYSHVIVIRVDIDTAMAESTDPLHTHQGIDIQKEQVIHCNIAQLFPPVHVTREQNVLSHYMYSVHKRIFTYLIFPSSSLTESGTCTLRNS